MRYTWAQKHNHEPDWKWDTVAESDNLWELVSQASAFQNPVSHSGLTGTHFVHNRIRCERTGKVYSSNLTKDMCLRLVAHDIAAEAISETE